MTFRVVTSELAASDIEDQAVWWANKHSVEQAQRWYEAIRAAIAELSSSPERWEIAKEHKLFKVEVRELHFGLGARPTHRVLFTISGETVEVLRVRHVARGPLRRKDVE